TGFREPRGGRKLHQMMQLSVVPRTDAPIGASVISQPEAAILNVAQSAPPSQLRNRCAIRNIPRWVILIVRGFRDIGQRLANSNHFAKTPLRLHFQTQPKEIRAPMAKYGTLRNQRTGRRK